MALRKEWKDNILYLSFETPNAVVNSLDENTIKAIIEAMSSIDVNSTKAVVFNSLKPGSFINGTNLLLSSLIVKPSDFVKSIELFRTAYKMVRESPVPTIAAIQGNCWGCGIEFILNCHYRLAEDSSPTNFFMTQVDHYLILPILGGADNLPLQVGFRNAVQLLLWGERWSARKATQENFVNEVAPLDRFDEQLEDFISRVSANKVSPCVSDEKAYTWQNCDNIWEDMTRERIEKLPPSYQPIYLDCLDLIIQSIKRPGDRQALRSKALKSTMSYIPTFFKTTTSFFFIRQMAHQLCTRNNPDVLKEKYKVHVLGKGKSLVSFKDHLRQERCENFHFEEKSSAEQTNVSRNATLFLSQSVNTTRKKALKPAVVHLAPADFSPENGMASPILYNPLYTEHPRFFELATDENHPDIQLLSSYLTDIGYTIVKTNPKEQFGINHFLLGYLRPLVFYISQEGRVEDVNKTLRDFGFIKRPHVLTKHLTQTTLSQRLIQELANDTPSNEISNALAILTSESYKRGEFDQKLIDAITISLLTTVQHCLETKCLPHPTTVDLIAREILDFPVFPHISLCRYLSPQLVADVLSRKSSFAHLTHEKYIHSAEKFLSNKARFYL